MSSKKHTTFKAEELKQVDVKIGLDIATKNTGLAIFVNGKLDQYGHIETNPDMPYSGDKLVKDTFIINRFFLGFSAKLKERLEKQHGDKEKFQINLQCGLESSNHANKSLGQKLATYIGLYTNAILNSFGVAFPHLKANIKLLNPREWQLRVFGEVLDRDSGKLKSIDKALEIIKRDVEQEVLEKVPSMLNITDDAADAINIANILGVLRDNLLVGQERRERVAKDIQNKKAMLRLEIGIHRLEKALLNKRQRQIERALLQKHNGKEKAQTLKEKRLWDFATATEQERIMRYQKELEQLKQDSQEINKFFIKGVTGID